MSNDISVTQMPAFKKSYKKLHTQHKKMVNEAIREIISNPECGQEKKGDLSDVWVHKFKVHTQLILLAYTWDPKTRRLIMLGTHENFYRDLKKL